MTSAPQSSSDPTVDPAAIATYAEMVFGYLGGLVPIRLFAETGTPTQQPMVRFCSPEQLAAKLQALAPWAASHSRGLYVVPGTVANSRSARAEDIVETGVLLVDIDQGDIDAIRAHLARYLPLPSLEVASGGRTNDGQDKCHLYWRLTEAATGDDLDRVRALRERVAARIGADPSFDSLHQPIRVPGSIHGKFGRQSPVRIRAQTHHEYELDDLIAAAEALPPMIATSGGAVPQLKRRTGPNAGDLMLTQTRAGGVDAMTRFDALSKVIGHWLAMVRQGRCTLEVAWTHVVNYNFACIVPPWGDDRLRYEFDGLLRRDIANHGTMPLPDSDTDMAEVGAPEFSDDALAGRFAAEMADVWRYVGAWGFWLAWTGSRWQRDEVARVREDMRRICRVAAASARTPSEARRIASDKTIAAALRIAAADPRLATSIPDWDSAPMLLNTPSGIIDLETGETLPHAPDRLITQITSAAPGGTCSRWLAFLEEITAGDADLQAYLKRLAGYCLTGSTREQVFFFLYGSGANGKSVFVQALTSALGEYAATATLSTFMASKTDRHLTELAGLRGARLVSVPETEAGQAWAEARIKMVTGGEKIRANFMHKDHFEFTPQFKLLVIGNHRPTLTSAGEAMRRRLHLVPFTVTIPARERDPHLMEKLLTERSGILAWALEGCAEWLRLGLQPPAALLAAAEDYFEDEDAVGQWIEDACVTGSEAQETSRALYASWSSWAEGSGQPRGSQKALGEALRERGFRPAKVDRSRGWLGIALRPVLARRDEA